MRAYCDLTTTLVHPVYPSEHSITITCNKSLIIIDMEKLFKIFLILSSTFRPSTLSNIFCLRIPAAYLYTTAGMSLFTIATELLGDILVMLSGNDIIQLWLTGDAKLHYLLSNRGALRSVSFILPWKSRLTYRLPSILLSLPHLESLHIRTWERIATPYRIWKVLSELPNLRSLHLSTEGSVEWLIDSNFEADCVFSLFGAIDDSDSLSNTQSSILSIEPLRPVAQALPNLEFLRLEFAFDDLVEEHIRFLPKSLTHLDLASYFNMHLLIPQLQHLPKLHTLRIRLYDESKDFSGLVLPATITSLRLVCNSHLTIPSSFWSLATDMWEVHAPLDPSSALALPKTIRTLATRSIPLNALPYSLTHLRAYLSPDTLGYDIASLPSTLTSLEISNFRRLAGLAPSAPVDDNASSLYRFPPNLKRFILHDNHSAAARMLESLKAAASSTLEYIRIISESDPLYTFESLLQLPSTLTSLRLDMVHQNSQPRVVIDSALPHLPHGLIDLLITNNCFYMTSWGIKHLPPNLKTLNVDFGHAEDDSMLPTHIAALPRSLQSLTLSRTVSVPDAPILRFDVASARFQMSKPKSLTESPVRLKKDPQWTPAMLSNLPRASLTSLTLYDAEATDWTKEAFESLPDRKSVV